MTQPLAQIPPFSTDWWPAFFDDDYAAYGLAATPPETIDKTIAFLMRVLDLQPGQTVFDQCCGIGRLSIPLAQRGMKVIAVDLMASYIQNAQRRAAEAAVDCQFHAGDALAFVTPRPCDAAINWFTSFGYTPDDERNILAIHRAFESLKPGARFVLDYTNLPRIFADFRQWFIDRPTAPGLEGLVVLHETQPDFLAGMMNSMWTFLYPDGRRTVKHVSTRMLLPSDLARMFRACGFGDIQLLGSIEGEPLTRTSNRCIVLGRKPA